MKKSLLMCFMVLALAVQGAGLSDAEWKAMKKSALERQRKIIIDNDGDDFSGSIPMNETVNPEKQMALRTSFMHKYPVDAIVYSVTYGSFDQLFVPNKYARTWAYAKPGQKNILQELLKMGTDPVKLQIDYCKKHNIEFWAGFRINDTHDAGDSPSKPWPGFPISKRQNPHLLMGSYYKQPPNATWSSWDFTHKEIRDKFANIVIDVAANYDVDGVYIDLYRWLGLFKSVAWGGEASDEEREMFSDMLRKIRTEIEKIGRERQKPILFAIRVPDSVDYCRAVGFDWENLMKEGIFDVVVVADNHHLQDWGKSVALCHKYGVKCYPSISMPCFVNLPRLSRHDPRSYFAREASALAAGTDGLFFFNVFEEGMVKKVVPPSFEDLKTFDKRYHISGMVHWRPSHNLATGEKYNQLPELSPVTPAVLSPGKTRDFKLEFGDDIVALRNANYPVNLTATLLADAVAGSVDVLVNGVALKHISSMGDSHSYEVPDNVFVPGCNKVTFRNKLSAKNKIPQLILKGNAIKKGENQFPWRRIFAGNQNNNEVEAIVDNSYKLHDNGNGFTNLVFPLDAADEEIDLSFEVKAEGADDAKAAAIRIAFAGKVEMVTFGKNQVGLAFANKSVKFDTASFKKYIIKADKKNITVSCNGKVLLSGKMTSSSNSKTKLENVIVAIPHAATRSIIVGSLSNQGKGDSYWKNMIINRPAGNVNLKDFSLDVRLSPLPTPKNAEPWDFVSKKGENKICAGIYPYQAYDFAAEMELDTTQGESEVFVSNGGLMCSFRVVDNGIIFNDAIPSLPLSASNNLKIRVDFDSTNANFFVEDKFVEVPLKGVSGLLRDSAEIRAVNSENDGIIRNSGIIIKTGNKNCINSLKVRMFAPEDKVAEAKKKLTYVEPKVPSNLTPIISYNAEAGMIGNSDFSSNYQANALVVADGKLRINNGDDNKSCYSMIFLNKADNYLKFDTPVLVKSKLKLLQPNGEDGNILQFSLNAGAEKITSSSVFFAPGRVILAGYGSFRNQSIKLNETLDFAWYFNPADGKNIFWINGKFIGEKDLKLDGKKLSFSFGDGSGTVAGVAEIESLELFQVK